MSGERMKLGTNTAVSIIAAAAILLMINYLSMRHYHRADWTSSGIYTLSDKTEKVLSVLDSEVTLYVLWSQGDPRFVDAKELLDNYSGLSSKIKLDVIDPDISPERVQIIIDRYGAKIHSDMMGNVGIESGVFVVSGDNVKFVSSQEFEDWGDGEFPGEASDGAKMSEFKAEQALTSAIMRVISDEQTTICFTRGHGEWALEGAGGRVLSQVADSLKRDSYRVEEFATAGSSRVPESCGVVVVAGPERAFMEEEAVVLEKYLDRGGRLLLLLDPIVEGDSFRPNGLEGLTSGRGIKLANDFMLEVDPRKLVSDTPVTFLVSKFTNHGSVATLSDLGSEPSSGAYPVVLSGARSMVHDKESDIVADVLATSSELSWGEMDLASLGSGQTVPNKDQYDTAGPAALAMAASGAVEGNGDGGRLIVVGDSDFLSEELFVNSSLFNRDFWSGLVGWLTARTDLISIAPKNPEHVQLNLTDDDISTIWQIVIGEVLLIIIAGVVIWIRRRR